MRKFMRRILRDNRAATAVEYGLIVALIVLGIMAALNSFAGESTRIFTLIESKVVPKTT